MPAKVSYVVDHAACVCVCVLVCVAVCLCQFIIFVKMSATYIRTVLRVAIAALFTNEFFAILEFRLNQCY